ncbi:Fe-S cluster assembly protein SufD [Limisphaera ngatamarikiensis]|uniref:Fe-S cluster assembly protein SufD n=1 Tax=Limisphaera ngatamarikiensis TaxID=1324935 RepID=A0A6M1RKN6_9BACT|nr:Fe-S cluster assembly protein SufD [Limisphaera ngatamarikiensis]NGO38057.1 Fe-S cluster assembly protein SufD [Limisphaera ngatamarikiensis]
MSQAAIETSRKVDKYINQFDRVAELRAQPAWLLESRRNALEQLQALGLPTLRDEDWRYTNVAPIARMAFKPALEPQPVDIPPDALNDLLFARVQGPRLVFVNGHYRPELSVLDGLPDGVRFGSLAAALEADEERVRQHLNRLVGTPEHGFTALNQAWFTDGAWVWIPADTCLEQPLQVVHLAGPAAEGLTFCPRNLLVVGDRAHVTLIESYVHAGAQRYFNNALTELQVGDEAHIEHLKFQDESVEGFHIAGLHASLGRACRAFLHSFALGGRISRYNLRVRLAGEGLEAILNGLYLTRGEQLADHHMIVEHAQPHCASHEYFNGILDDRSRGVFHGRILVRPGAQKTDAKQTNKNLLLSDEAQANTKPQLEIYADDVKCTHGATVGQLHPEAIFYLRSRGIGPDTARRMLIHAFAGEIIERVQYEPAREILDQLVWDRLEATSHLAVPA